MSIADLQAALGYTFNNPALLEEALVHRSYIHEHHDCPYDSNERLEFLGDALLNFITGAFLYHTYPDRREGELTIARAALVQTRTLAEFARRFDLGPYIRLSRGEDRSGARERDNLLADTFEALLAAIALDSDWHTARDWILPLLRDEMDIIDAGDVPVDYKTTLQHRVQGEFNVTPLYNHIAVSGPDHEREWTMEVWANGVLLGQGTGSSKRHATQAAAQHALAALDSATPPLLARANEAVS